MNDGFVFYSSFLEAIKDLPDEMRLQAYDAICTYGIEEVEPEVSGVAKAIFIMAKPQIDANQKRRRVGKANGMKGAEYGKLGGRPKKNPQETPKGDIEKPPKEKDKEKDKVKDKEKNKYAESVAEIKEQWNKDSNLINIREIKAGSKRYQALTARIDTYGVNSILTAIEKVQKSDFCHGKSERGWVADFDWFVRPDTINRVLEGKYDNRQKKTNFGNFKGRDDDDMNLLESILLK